MKRLLFFICTLLCANVIMAQVGTTFWIGDIQYEITSTNPAEVEVNDANISITTAIIPSTVSYDGTTYSVTSIGDYALSSCSSLTSITIPNSVTSIGERAFLFCHSLTSVTIPNSVTSIGKYAFWSCSSLTSVTIGNSVTSIGDYAFWYCSSLTSVTIPNSVTSIGNSAFWYCSSLTSVTIPNSVTSIGNSAFEDCSSLTSVTIGNSVTSIGVGAFQFCSSLTSVTIGNSVTSIGGSAFNGCSSLTSVTIPNSVTSIGSAAFADCSSLTSVTIGNSVTSIGNYAFSWCSSLTSIDIPNSVTSIGNWAFFSCSSLTSVTIPNSVNSIGYTAFSGCSSLTSVTCLAEIAPSLGVDVFASTPSTKVLNIPCGSDYSSWESATDWASVECTWDLGNSLTYFPLTFAIISVEERTMKVSDCDVSATDVEIPARVMYNGVNYSVTSIGNSAFEDCSSLTSVTIPNSVTSIGNSAFFSCSSLTSVNIPNSVTSIGVYAFADCSSLTSVTIGNSVTSIGNYAFEYCSSLTSINIPNSVTSIGKYAFRDCDGLTSVTIPNSVTSIGQSAFYRCGSLTSVTIGNSVTSVGDYAFEYCSSLTSVNIPNSVTSIGNSAFYNCSGLTSVTIGNSVTSIGHSAFRGCGSLISVTCLAETAPSLGGIVFLATPSNKTLTVPFGATGYTSDWDNDTWQKIYHKINEGEIKTLTNAFEITEDNKRGVINEGVLRITQSGQLINQTSTNVGGIIEVEAINRENNWNYIGAPFNNYVLGVILPQENDVSVSTFNHNTGNWNTNWATNEIEIPTGEGFAAWNFASSPIIFTTYGDVYDYAGDSVGEYEFENIPDFSLFNEEQITITHSDNNSEDNVNWLSIANPYAFKLDVEKIINQNSLQGNVLYKYNGTTFIPVSSGEIQVTEGFFVNNQSITLKKSQQHTLSAKTKMQKDYIRLAVNDGENEIELQFAHNEDAKQDYDIFDANKLFSPLEITEPYFVTDGVALVKEEVKEYPYTATLNIRNYETKEITLSIDNIPEGVNVYLIDNGFEVKMNGGVEYNTRIIKGENADRFKVLFKKQHRLEKINDNQISITNNNRQISVKSDKTDLNIEVYNQLGQKVFSTNEYNFTLSEQPAGSYVIKAYQGRFSESKKIVIE